MIVAEGLTKRFGPTLAVDDVSFEVRPGQVVGFVGHNGAGKTTTLKMLLGLIRPTAGQATVLGRPFRELDHPLRRVGVLLGSGAHPGRTGRDHLRVASAVGGIKDDRVDYLLDMVGLADDADRHVGGYSQGMRQRLGIATALLGDPEVVILDEPANGLDPGGIRWLRSLLKALAEGGRTVLISSHHLEEVARTVDHVIAMDRGVIVEEAPLEQILEGEGQDLIVRTPGAEVLAAALERDGIRVELVHHDELRASGTVPRAVYGAAHASGIPIWEVRPEQTTLEDAFLRLTQEGQNGDGPAGSEDAGDSAGATASADPGETPADADEATAGDDESRLDERLRRIPPAGRTRTVAVVAPERGQGRTTLAFLIADAVAAVGGIRTLAVALSADRERMALPAPRAERSQLDLGDLIRDLPGFDDAARITPYVSVAESGAHTLAGPRDDRDLGDVDPGRLDELLAFASRFYELIVLDVAETPEPLLRAAVARADEAVLVSTPDSDPDPGGSVTLDALEQLRDERATLVLNAATESQVRAFAGGGQSSAPHAVVPHDRELIRALDAGDFRLDRCAPDTRVALKRLALAVMEGLT